MPVQLVLLLSCDNPGRKRGGGGGGGGTEIPTEAHTRLNVLVPVLSFAGYTATLLGATISRCGLPAYVSFPR